MRFPLAICIALVSCISQSTVMYDGSNQPLDTSHGAATKDGDTRIHFAAIGDIPYEEDPKALTSILNDVGAKKMPFVLHMGDIWGSPHTTRHPCSKKRYQQRKGWFDRSPVPFVIVPGDNEVTDCPIGDKTDFDGDTIKYMDWRIALDRFNKYVLGNPCPCPKEPCPSCTQDIYDFKKKLPPLHTTRMPGRAENIRWIYENVGFVGVNLPAFSGTVFCLSQAQLEKNLILAKTSFLMQNATFINDAFSEFDAKHVEAIVVFMQSDPETQAPVSKEIFKTKLKALVSAFKKPVLLIHGNGHQCHFDPVYDKVGNWARIEVPQKQWVEVTYDKTQKKFGRATHPDPNFACGVTKP